MRPVVAWLMVLLCIFSTLPNRASSSITGQFFRTNTTLMDRDLAQVSNQLLMDIALMSSTTCAAFCMLQEAVPCYGFSIQKHSNNGSVMCKTSRDPSATVSLLGAVVYFMERPGVDPSLELNASSSTGAQSNAATSDGYTFTNITGKYYKMHFQESKNYTDADQLCRTEGGRLALTYGATGKQIVQYYSGAYSQLAFWFVDGSDDAQDGQWVFSDGTILNDSQKATDPRQNWPSWEPNNWMMEEDCLSGSPNGWADYACFKSLPFLCERDY